MTGRIGYRSPSSNADATLETRRRSREVMWVSVLPLLVLAVSVPCALFLPDPNSVAGDVVVMWTTIGVLSSVVFAPAIALSLLGAKALHKGKGRYGRWLVSIGSVAASLTCAAVVFVVLDDAMSPARRDPNSWGPALTPFSGFAVVAPYILGAAGNAYVVGRLWLWPRTATTVQEAPWPTD